MIGMRERLSLLTLSCVNSWDEAESMMGSGACDLEQVSLPF